ncbi:MAG: cell division protein FtsN [Cocleimonas sp.]|jgi:cell division protein FtsN
MYKDFKKSETLDTGFTSGSSLLWMFSGIVLGLLVGLGMYFFSNDKMPRVSMIDSLEKKIQKVQTEKSATKNLSSTSKPKFNNTQEKNNKKAVEERKNKFSYYAVLPNLDVPVSSAKPINTSPTIALATNNAETNTNQQITEQVTVAIDEQVEAPVEEAVIGDYLLQVASFKKESMADKTRGRLSNKGIDAYVQKKKIKGRFWYRVVAGPVDQRSVDNWKYTAEKLGHKPLVISVR